LASVWPTWEYALTSWNCSACRTEISALLATLIGEQRSSNCTWPSEFLTCTITCQNYAGNRQKPSKII
jgi:hypothetical protein